MDDFALCAQTAAPNEVMEEFLGLFQILAADSGAG